MTDPNRRKVAQRLDAFGVDRIISNSRVGRSDFGRSDIGRSENGRLECTMYQS
jgi:hypothetical protein